ncbi:cupin [Amphritea opalescens]|uniref:Acireductone dioxygenase n=1 Tax=Amphritea opalescens TaxID=2490544 RepID=A0A430KM05_9GAMM|nr:cupin [Amphritea opalescens]RTE64508.1 cupin [Amphritea opalescens]
MSELRVYQDDKPEQPLTVTCDAAEISQQLADVGVRFERWQAAQPISAESQADEILAAYAAEIQRLKDEQGYVTVDTMSLASDHPAKDELRQKFLSEHTHSEDEVRFFVRGEGIFYLHIADKVYRALCCKDDLISVPANTTHWFDMGPEPDFTAIRLFNNPEGWVANYSGSAIADQFPKFED